MDGDRERERESMQSRKEEAKRVKEQVSESEGEDGKKARARKMANEHHTEDKMVGAGRSFLSAPLPEIKAVAARWRVGNAPGQRNHRPSPPSAPTCEAGSLVLDSYPPRAARFTRPNLFSLQRYRMCPPWLHNPMRIEERARQRKANSPCPSPSIPELARTLLLCASAFSCQTKPPWVTHHNRPFWLDPVTSGPRNTVT